MKRFVITVVAVMVLALAAFAVIYQTGLYIDLTPNAEPTAFARTEGQTILLQKDGQWQPFLVKGVNIGNGLPGEWSTDYAIDQQTYLRWFSEIQQMGANTIRVYSILSDDFYNAFYEYNTGREDPLYLIQGVWVSDYVQNSHMDAFDRQYRQKLIDDTLLMVDVIHGQRAIFQSDAYMGSGIYLRDVSQWVLGYILGVEWEATTVAYTNEKYPERSSYQGRYLRTTDDAAPFEALLAEVGDRLLAYESARYDQQRLFAFTNWVTTDPITYPEQVTRFFLKCAQVDVEHIQATDQVVSGQFASYHVYPYYQDYLAYIEPEEWSAVVGQDVDFSDCIGEDGTKNTYRAYLKLLTAHHSMPVVISEFGVSTGRGMAQRDQNTGRNQGHMSEKEQGEALIACYEDLLAAGCAGGAVFSWQDEWFKRTWNTMHAIDMSRNPYWSDYQTNEQYFGLLSFDPGETESICYVDGDVSEWRPEDVVASYEDGSFVSMKYDERFLYFRIHKPGLVFEQDTLYLPIDTTPKTGTTYCENYALKFERAADFLLVLHGSRDSRLLVQDRYDSLMANYSENVTGIDIYLDPPAKDSPAFNPIHMILQTSTMQFQEGELASAETYETGLLRCGDANPSHEGFDSLADFCCNGEDIEVKLPWQLLNFADPSRMKIHDDYYDGNYGIKFISISELYVGLGSGQPTERIPMERLSLKGWGNKVTAHERLKPSYYLLKSYWTGGKAQ